MRKPKCPWKLPVVAGQLSGIPFVALADKDLWRSLSTKEEAEAIAYAINHTYGKRKKMRDRT